MACTQWQVEEVGWLGPCLWEACSGAPSTPSSALEPSSVQPDLRCRDRQCRGCSLPCHTFAESRSGKA